MKKIKINRYYNKRGNSYATRDEQECLGIICKKLKVSTNPKIDENYFENISKYLSIENQVKKQYDCNKRDIVFEIKL